ncbi:M12 family metallopeptidase [Paraburkholderia fungorum]|uniref:M12 family metallopeptidase n=1 Tax=Paraburkholderia fungorum TaxID=134537 RepID=UPI0038BBCDCA
MATRFRQTVKMALGILASGSLLVECVFPQTSANEIFFGKIDTNLTPYGYVSTDHLWPHGIVEVCWENGDDTNRDARLTAESAVENSWQRVAKITFRGWKSCVTGFQGIRIRIIDDGGNPTSLIGTRLDKISNGMQLNLTFKRWYPDICGARVDECIKVETMHEFGHALGLIHENIRSDAPQKCKDRYNADGRDIPPGDADTKGTDYDPDSIMNYCHLIYQHAAMLSKNDEKVAILLYGAR